MNIPADDVNFKRVPHITEDFVFYLTRGKWISHTAAALNFKNLISHFDSLIKTTAITWKQIGKQCATMIYTLNFEIILKMQLAFEVKIY